VLLLVNPSIEWSHPSERFSMARRVESILTNLEASFRRRNRCNGIGAWGLITLDLDYGLLEKRFGRPTMR